VKSFVISQSLSRTRSRAAVLGLIMSKILRILGQALLRPIIKLKATNKRNAIIYANMSPEQLRERKRMLEELRFMREQRSELLLRHKLPGQF
jgi:retron-type reverse transcriptase